MSNNETSLYSVTFLITIDGASSLEMGLLETK